MKQKAKNAGIPAHQKKAERLRIQDENLAALRMECDAYVDRIGDAVFKKYLSRIHPNADLMEDVPLSVAAEAADVAFAAKHAAREGMGLVLVTALLTAPLALKSEKGRKSAKQRKTRSGGRKPDQTPWVVRAKQMCKYRDLDTDLIFQRLVSGNWIEQGGGTVRTLDEHLNVTNEVSESDFRQALSKLVSRTRSKKSSSRK